MALSILLDAVKEWAMGEDAIQSILLIGSHARNQARADSDVDLIVIASDPKRYIIGTFFYGFGKVTRCQKEDWGTVTPVRVFYENGLEVEFAITSPDWLKLPFEKGTHETLSGGYRILLDKENNLADLIQDALS